MKRYLPGVLLLVLSLTSRAQTPAEAKEWLKSKIDAYGETPMSACSDVNGRYGQVNSCCSFTLSCDNDYTITLFETYRKSDTYSGQDVYKFVYRFNLSDIKKVLLINDSYLELYAYGNKVKYSYSGDEDVRAGNSSTSSLIFLFDYSAEDNFKSRIWKALNVVATENSKLAPKEAF